MQLNLKNCIIFIAFIVLLLFMFQISVKHGGMLKKKEVRKSQQQDCYKTKDIYEGSSRVKIGTDVIEQDPYLMFENEYSTYIRNHMHITVHCNIINDCFSDPNIHIHYERPIKSPPEYLKSEEEIIRLANKDGGNNTFKPHVLLYLQEIYKKLDKIKEMIKEHITDYKLYGCSKRLLIRKTVNLVSAIYDKLETFVTKVLNFLDPDFIPSIERDRVAREKKMMEERELELKVLVKEDYLYNLTDSALPSLVSWEYLATKYPGINEKQAKTIIDQKFPVFFEYKNKPYRYNQLFQKMGLNPKEIFSLNRIQKHISKDEYKIIPRNYG